MLSEMSVRSRHIPKNSEFNRSPRVDDLGAATEETTNTISAGPSGTSACRVMWRSNSRLAGTWCHNHSKTKFLKGQGLIDAKGSEGVIRLPASRIKLRRRGRRFRQPKRLPLSESVQVVDCALGLGGGLKDCAVIVLENLKPDCDIGRTSGVISRSAHRKAAPSSATSSSRA